MVSTNHGLDVSHVPMCSSLKSLAPRFRLGIRQSDGLENFYGRVTLDNIQPTFSEKKRTDVLVIVDILNWHCRIVKGRRHCVLKDLRVLGWVTRATIKYRDVDGKESLVGTFREDLAVPSVGGPIFRQNVAAAHVGLMVFEPDSTPMKTTMTSTTKNEWLGIDGNPKDRADRVVRVRHVLHRDETIFPRQVAYDTCRSTVMRIMFGGVVAYVAGVDSFTAFDTNKALEHRVDNNAQRREVVSVMDDDGVRVGELHIRAWIKVGAFRLWGIVIERKVDNLWYGHRTKNNIFRLLLDTLRV